MTELPHLEQPQPDRPGVVVAGVAVAALAGLLGWAVTRPAPEASRDDAPQMAQERDAVAAPVETGAAPSPPATEPGEPPAVEPQQATGRAAGAATADAAERLATCERIAAKLGSVSLEDCTDSRLELSGARSNQGTPILVAEFPPLPEREPLGRVLLFGGIHGDEFSSVSLVYSWLDTLERYHSGLFHWRIAPLVNPDGLLRKRSQRMNDRGVDLNRNFPSPNWLVEAPEYWIKRTSRNPRRYPGEAPLSEPESRWLHQQIESFRPAAIVAVHAPSHVVDYDGPPEPPERLGPLLLEQLGTYPGSLGRFAGVHLGLPVVTIELPSAGTMPTREDQRHMWVDLVAWLRRNVPRREAERMALLEEPAAAPSAAGANLER